MTQVPPDFPFLPPGQPPEPAEQQVAENQGILGAIVWPPYIGLATGEVVPGDVAPGTEPFEDINYNRAMIAWRTLDDGDIVGGATIFVPKGVFTHIAFFSGPGKEHAAMGCNRMEQPLVFDRAGMVEIDPIRNQDYLPRQPA